MHNIFAYMAKQVVTANSVTVMPTSYQSHQSTAFVSWIEKSDGRHMLYLGKTAECMFTKNMLTEHVPIIIIFTQERVGMCETC